MLDAFSAVDTAARKMQYNAGNIRSLSRLPYISGWDIVTSLLHHATSGTRFVTSYTRTHYVHVDAYRVSHTYLWFFSETLFLCGWHFPYVFWGRLVHDSTDASPWVGLSSTIYTWSTSTSNGAPGGRLPALCVKINEPFYQRFRTKRVFSPGHM